MAQLSLSTMWMQNRFDRLVEFCHAGEEIGFSQFELSHIITPAMFEGFSPGAWTVSSVHDPCPRPARTTNPGKPLFLSSTDPVVRTAAVEVACNTIKTAVCYGASVVVFHLGRVDLSDGLEFELRSRFQAGLYGSPEYALALERITAARAAAAGPHLDAVIQSLEVLIPYAREHGVRLGFETRVNYGEIPSFEEMGQILNYFDEPSVGFWLDTGHAQVLANLGFHPLADWLHAYGSRLIGVHFHDVHGLRDHLIPGTGEVDFSSVAHCLSADTVRTCEFDWYFTEDEIRQGVAHLQAAGCCDKVPG